MIMVLKFVRPQLNILGKQELINYLGYVIDENIASV